MSRLRRALSRLMPTHHTQPVGTVPDAAAGAAGTAGDGVSYAPRADGQPDPGEVVWGWVPYEDDATQGKDRPVLLLGRRGDRWLGLMLTSQDHDHDAADEARHGRYWMDVGAGAWDRERRPSEVRLDRLLELDPASIRREGAALPREVFDAVLVEARRFHDLG
ncbi:type II toxin-antitoxin system PemK/MazF family toxin [Nocardioides sp. GCM10027113]|uniref:type II toxin-antitoxin system PemK/MazF family toxin n=1 Tax=unclassified Nocardioides TaxID=2615069 RepID=UPI003623E546